MDDPYYLFAYPVYPCYGQLDCGKRRVARSQNYADLKNCIWIGGEQRPYLIAVNYAEFRGTANFGNAYVRGKITVKF